MDTSIFAQTIINSKYAHVKSNGNLETWDEIANRVATHVLGAINASKENINEVAEIISKKQFIPAGRYLYAAGRHFHQCNNCLTLIAEDSREGWSDLLRKASMALMTGAGIGVSYSKIRGEGLPINKTGGYATGPLALMQMVNEVSRGVMQGGARRSAVLSLLSWKHPDIYKFIEIKNWDEDVKTLKAKNFNFPAPLDGTNISVHLDDEFFKAFNNQNHKLNSHAISVYWATVRSMLKSGEPGFSIDIGDNKNEIARNACSEYTSSYDSNICNLGSINLARINSLEEMKKVTELGTMFLVAGSVYSDVPYEEVKAVKEVDRRIGLGLMGLHEWLLVKNKKYDIDEDLSKYLDIYKDNLDIANKYANKWSISKVIKARALAPTGTISIVAETTSGIEPLFCSAYKRRYRKGTDLIEYQYVLDPTAKRLVDKGLNPDAIEDAYGLAEDVERRVKFQSWIQTNYIDMGVSSTINLPSFGTPQNNHDTITPFGNMLFKYLPKLRGITTYPANSRGAQPLTPVHWHTAVKHVGQVFIEGGDVCSLKGGSCNS